MKKALIFGLSVISFLHVQAGGPWLQAKGNGYFQIGGSSKRWDGRYQGTYSHTIHRDLNRDVRERYLAVYFEYGLTEKLTLIGDIPIRFQSTSSNINTAGENPFSDTLKSGGLAALGNSCLGLKYPINLSSSLKMAVQIKTWFNTSSFEEKIGLRTDYDAYTLMPSIIIGKSKAKSNWSFDAGFMLRTNNYGESISGNFQIGRNFWKKGVLILDVNYLFSLENGKHNDGTSVHTATFVDNQGYFSYGLKIYQKFTPTISANIAVYQGFAVINQGTQPRGVFLAMAYELKR